MHDGRTTRAALTMIDNEATLTFDLQTPSQDDGCAPTYSKQRMTPMQPDEIRSAQVTYGRAQAYRIDTVLHTLSPLCRCRCLNKLLTRGKRWRPI